MEIQKTSSAFWCSLIISALIGILLGILLLVLDAGLLLTILFIVLGVITVLTSIPGVVAGGFALKTRDGAMLFAVSLISAAIGLTMIFWHSTVLLIILGIYLIVVPIVEILLAADKKKALKSNLAKLILGVVMIVVGPADALNVLFRIAGWVLIILTALGAVLAVVDFQKKQNATGSRVFVDKTGDGKIDSVVIDTTGDGVADTETRYRGKK